jgi:phosphatidylserine/phosphatidylglycerophosphate/cardiolipin synthase-like enzyme
MKKKAKTKKNKRRSGSSLKKWLLSTITALLISFFAWIQQPIQTIHPPEAGTPAALYSNQTRHDLRQAMVTAINDAKESIMLIMFALTDTHVIDALRKKSEEGVSVHVVCDAKASPYIEKKLGPKVKTIRRFGQGLMHQKILVIDKKQTWIGSANMTTESLHMHGNLVTAIHSAQFAQSVISKGQTLHEEGKDGAFAHEEFNIGGQPIELWFLPDNPKAVSHLKTLIESAKKTLRVAMFTFTRQDLAHAVISAAKRGVKAEVVIDNSSGKGTSAKIVDLLKKNGIPTALSQGKALLHHKFAYIDDSTLINGSANWTKAAFSQNDDCFIVLHNLTDDQKKEMDALWNAIKTESIPVD